MAFQPIVDVRSQAVFAYEALVRGLDGSSASQILSQVNDDNRYQFDQACRVKAVSLAARLGIACHVSINFLPNAVYEPAVFIPPNLRSMVILQYTAISCVNSSRRFSITRKPVSLIWHRTSGLTRAR